jgi:hypothetical protein
MNGLIPKEKKLYLPYTQRTTVSMIYFDASEVFALLNQDAIFWTTRRSHLLHHKHFQTLVTSTQVVATERHTRPMLRSLALICVMAMDKTHIDMAERKQMEPITISCGLLNHITRPPKCHAHPWIHQSQHPRPSPIQCRC